MVNIGDLLNNGSQLSDLLLSSVEEGDVYRFRRRKLHYLIKSSDYDFLNGQDRFVDCSDFKKISIGRFSEVFSGNKLKGRINGNDMAAIKEAICSYENISVKMLKRFGLIE